MRALLNIVKDLHDSKGVVNVFLLVSLNFYILLFLHAKFMAIN